MVKVRIRFTLSEAQPGEIVVDPSVLSTGCFLQPIQSPLESTHMRLMIEGLETLWLLNVHLLLNLPIEECCLHVHLVDLPPHLS